MVSTSALGAVVNLPFKTLIGWGLDPETAGIVQASGRVGRKPMIDKGNVVWVSFQHIFVFKVYGFVSIELMLFI